jgi:hypothetical protein
MTRENKDIQKDTNQNPESTEFTPSPLPQSKITPPTVTPYDNTPKKVRLSEVVIILAIVFGCIICGLLAWGVVALIRHFPVWWHNVFGMAKIIFTA